MATHSLGQYWRDQTFYISYGTSLCTNNVWFSLDENTPQSTASTTQQAANYPKLRGQKYNENRQRILTCTFSHFYQIWHFLTEHHNQFNSAIKCSIPQPMQLLTKFLSWTNNSASAIHHWWTKTTRCHFIWIVTASSPLQRVALQENTSACPQT